MKERVTVVLQAGGLSRRMGMDKALVPFMGTTLLGYILDQVKSFSDDIILINNRRPGYDIFGLPEYEDLIPEWGALGGLHAAISHASRELCLVLACDMPFLQMDLLAYMVEVADEFDAVVPRWRADGFSEPFRAVYRKTCLPSIEEAIRMGMRRANSFFPQVRVRYVSEAEIRRFDPTLETFFNVNTPEDLEEAERIGRLRSRDL